MSSLFEAPSDGLLMLRTTLEDKSSRTLKTFAVPILNAKDTCSGYTHVL